MNPHGIVTRPSQYSVKETIDRLVIYLEQHGAIVYARMNHQSELRNVGLKISPLEFILFGDPKAGGRVMIENPLASLDLPLKIIAWEDNQNNVWIAYIDSEYIENRYSLPHTLMEALDLTLLIDQALTV
jgi:uncharacterized protein (DUF302 family)